MSSCSSAHRRPESTSCGPSPAPVLRLEASASWRRLAIAGVHQECYPCPVFFTWDAKKAAANARKHAVTFAEAETVFDDPLAGITEDTEHPERLILLGQSSRRRLLLVVHVEIDQDTVRLTSAGRGTREERRRYQEDNS